MKQTKQKALLYCRVSSKSQEEDGHGLDSQEHRCREYAALKQHEVAAVFPDTISGGGDFMKRPGMVALLSFLDAQPGEPFVVIFDDLKRFARDTRFHLDLRDAFKKRGAQIECLNFKFEDSPEGEFIETIMAAQGALERKQNGRQVAQKMKARMQSGYWVHQAAIGYRYEAVKGRGKILLPHEPFAKMVREAFEGRAMGRFQSDAEVKRFFESFPDFPRDRNGVLTQQRVTEILTQPLYTGYICSETYGIAWLKGHHEALISLETFDKVQERRNGISKAPLRKNIGDDFALRGMACCAGCGVPLRSSWSKGRNKPYAYYLCQTKSCESYGKSIPRDRLEGDVGKLIRGLEPTAKLFSLARAMFAVAWEQRRQQGSEIIRSGQRQIAAAEKQIETLLSRIMDASNATVIRNYESKITELERSKIVLAEQMAKQAEPKGKFEEQLEPALTFLANPWKLWQTGDIALRRTVLKLAFADRIEYCRIEGPRTPKIALPFKALTGGTDEAVSFGAA
ncbi:recombinase family protein [Mesorhizobium sp. J428]|uniref:recombinase family protein n=1 Tax=Mesorhizobium sp. J428 TaxID=2898440 RepID=UPI002150C7CA|nr:recombinase family protein [Mesorhizobium sp. J428]MCR5858260.1 recombinase family protein [Mesorhizobium sp. J428]